MASYDRTRAWKPWSGELAQLADAAEICKRALREHARSDTDPRIDITIEQRNLTTSLDSLEELREGAEIRDLREVKALSIGIGSYWSGIGVLIRGTSLSFVGGLTVSVKGSDRIWVEGLLQRVTEALMPRWRLQFARLLRGPAPFIAVSAGLLVFAALNPLLKFGLDVEDAASIAIAAISGLLVAIAIAATGFATLMFELLPSGGVPRFQRWRGRIVALVGTVTVGVVTSIVATAIWAGG